MIYSIFFFKSINFVPVFEFDEENGDCLWDYWVGLGKYRDEAFKIFKERKSSIEDQFKKKIHNIISMKGLPYIEELYGRAKDDYIENFSQLGFSKELTIF